MLSPPATLLGAFGASDGAFRRLAAAAPRLHASHPFALAGAAAFGRAATGTTVAFVGRLTDDAPLREQLPDAGPRAVADAVAEGYERLGAAVLPLLIGEWALAVRDRDGRGGLLARDPLGGRSLHYAAEAGGLVLGEEVRDVLALLRATPAPDAASVASWLGGGIVRPGRSLLERIDAVPAGHALRLGDGPPRLERFWAPRPGATLDADLETLAATLLEGLRGAVARAIDPGVRPAVRLSGGLDSSIVAAVARSCGPLRAYSAVFPGHPSADEAALVEATADQLDLEGRRSVVKDGRVVLGGLPHLEAWRLPSASPNSFLWLPLQRAAAAEGVDVMLDGEGGDELFDSHPFWLFADLVRGGRPLEAWRLTRRYRGVGPATTARHRGRILWYFARRGLTPHLLQRAGRAARLARGRSLIPRRSEGVAAADPWVWKRLDGPLWWRYRAYTLTRLRELVDAPGTFRRHAVLAGVRDAHPLMLDRPLVELALTVPPEASFAAGHDRPVARRAMAGQLPAPVLERTGKSHFSDVVYASMAGAERTLTRRLLGARDARLAAYADMSYVRDVLLADRPGEGHALGHHGWAAEAWRATAVECWLRDLEDDAFAPRLRAENASPPPLSHTLAPLRTRRSLD